MSEEDNPTSETGQEPDGKTQAGDQKPWGDEPFDADRAWKLIQGLRADKDSRDQKITELGVKVQKFEDAQLSAEERTAKQTREATAEMQRISRENLVLKEAMAAGLTQDHLPFISGDSPEEVKNNIAKFRALLQAGTAQAPTGRPREQPLRAGTDPLAPPTPTDWLRGAITH
jgi:hypothetical protein